MTVFRLRDCGGRRVCIATPRHSQKRNNPGAVVRRGVRKMEDESEQHAAKASASVGLGRIFGLTDEEREMLREFAVQLRGRVVRNQVAQRALDGAADELDRVASSPEN